MKTIKQMENILKENGIWIESLTPAKNHSDLTYWFLFFNDSDHATHIKTDGTNGGASKSYAKKQAKDSAIIERYNKEYK